MNDKYLKTFIKNIERIAPNWSSYKLSQESGVSQATLSKMFSGQSVPTLETIVKIAECLNVKPGDLLDDTTQSFSSTVPDDVSRMLENQSPLVYDTIRTLLTAMKHQPKKAVK